MTVYCVCFYIIYEGTYRPRAIFSDQARAEKYMATLKPDDDQSGHSIHEYVLDAIGEGDL